MSGEDEGEGENESEQPADGGEDQPGFGIAAAIAALVAAGLLFFRRR